MTSPLKCGRAALVYHRHNRTQTVQVSIARNLQQTFIDNRDFYTPPALATAVNFNGFE